ncbi:hypothetical protein [Streptomyces sp. NPDC001492]
MSTSWYTTQASSTGEPSQGTEEPTEEPTGDPTEEPTEPSSPAPVVTKTVIAVPPGGSGGDDGGSLIAALGSLLSGIAAVGTLLHAVHLSRQNRSSAAPDDDPTPATTS